MAIAGGAVPAIPVSLRGGGLVFGQSHMVQDAKALSVDDAIDALLLLGECELRLYGSNKDALERRWQREIIGEL